MTKQGLALHTTTGELGIALVTTEGKYRLETWDLGRNLANELQAKLQEFMLDIPWQEIEFLAVAVGPGSYTSTRIGVVTARILAQQLNIPLYGISTLKAFAWHYFQQTLLTPIVAVEMKANQEQVFGAIYEYKNPDNDLISLMNNQLFSLEKWKEITHKYQTQFNQRLEIIKTPDKLGFNAQSIVEIALLFISNNQYSDWQNVLPFYS